MSVLNSTPIVQSIVKTTVTTAVENSLPAIKDFIEETIAISSTIYFANVGLSNTINSNILNNTYYTICSITCPAGHQWIASGTEIGNQTNDFTANITGYQWTVTYSDGSPVNYINVGGDRPLVYDPPVTETNNAIYAMGYNTSNDEITYMIRVKYTTTNSKTVIFSSNGSGFKITLIPMSIGATQTPALPIPFF